MLEPVPDNAGQDPPALVLLGAPATGQGLPGPALQRRIDCALAVSVGRPSLSVLAAGGIPPRARCQRPEAEVAADALQRGGIADARILLETRSRNTCENAAYSVRLIRARQPGLHAEPAAMPTLLIVTDPWHIPRARLAFRVHGARARAVRCPMGWRDLIRSMPLMVSHEVLGFGFHAYPVGP